jgi:hypothetical protein
MEALAVPGPPHLVIACDMDSASTGSQRRVNSGDTAM